MRINKENSIGLIIDMQEKLVPHIHNNKFIVENCLKIIHGLKILDVPLLVTQQYTKGLGDTIPEINKAIGNFTYIEKNTFSCYREPAFIQVLNRIGRRNVIIVGIETHVCLLQTSLDLIYNNFNPVIIIDATGSRKETDKEVALWRIRDIGSIVSTTESILFELCKKAGTDEFKAISKLIK